MRRLPLVVWLALPAAAGAQAASAVVRPVAEAGLVGGTPWLTDASGITVSPAAAPYVGLGARLVRGPRTSMALQLRVARPGVRVRADEGGRWRAGRATTIEAAGSVAWRLHPRASAGAGAGVVRLRGPADVSPFRFSNARALHPFAQGELVVHARHADLVARASAHRFGGETVGHPVREPGTVARLSLGAARAF